MCPKREKPFGSFTKNGVSIIIDSPGFKGDFRFSFITSIHSGWYSQLIFSPFTVKSKLSINPLLSESDLENLDSEPACLANAVESFL